MTTPITTLSKSLPVSIAVSDPKLRHLSRLALDTLQPSVVMQEMQQTGAGLVEAASIAQPAVLVADLGALGENFGETIRKLRMRPDPPAVVVLHHSADGGTILKAMRAGAHEFFFEEIETSLRESVRGFASERETVEVSSGKLYAFIAAKGGCGATTLASHAAASLAKGAQSKVLFADMNFDSPSAAFLFRAHPQYSLRDATERMNRMDSALWNAMVTPTLQGFDMAPPPTRNTDTFAILPENLSMLLRFCKTQYGNVIADCGDGVNHLTPTLLDVADEVILVTSTDVLALHHTRRLLASIQEITGTARVRLVLNRVRRRPELGQGDMGAMLGQPIFASVPNDYRSLMQAFEKGVLLSSEHEVAQSVSAMMGQLAGAVTTRKKKRFGLFGN